MDNTLEYYNTNAKKLTETTVSVDFTEIQTRFINKLSNNACVLDFGCGSGRDTKYFLGQGLNVEATDGSKELNEFMGSDPTVVHNIFILYIVMESGFFIEKVIF